MSHTVQARARARRSRGCCCSLPRPASPDGADLCAWRARACGWVGRLRCNCRSWNARSCCKELAAASVTLSHPCTPNAVKNGTWSGQGGWPACSPAGGRSSKPMALLRRAGRAAGVLRRRLRPAAAAAAVGHPPRLPAVLHGCACLAPAPVPALPAAAMRSPVLSGGERRPCGLAPSGLPAATYPAMRLLMHWLAPAWATMLRLSAPGSGCQATTPTRPSRPPTLWRSTTPAAPPSSCPLQTEGADAPSWLRQHPHGLNPEP